MYTQDILWYFFNMSLENQESTQPPRPADIKPKVPTQEDKILFGYNPATETFNEELVEKVLQNHIPGELEKLRILSGHTKEQIELYSQYAILRKSTLSEMRESKERRLQENPIKTPEEEKLGVFLEMIEPQVRNAVLKIQAKGYETWESGFDSGAGQMIGFKKDYFKNPAVFEALKNELNEQKINFEMEPDQLRIKFEKMYSLEEIGKIWDKIAEALPNLNDKI